MSDDDDKAKKLGSAIRMMTESTEFDLAGYGADGCSKLAAALENPLPLPDMIRISFVVGGGKKVRQKYNDGLPMLLGDALKKAGFTEDRGASLAMECAGTFKFQHNTDTDLKTTHVYPKVDQVAAAAEAEAANPTESDPLSPAELLLYAPDQRVFGKMIDAKCISFTQKRKALEVLKAARAEITAIEAKMTNMEALSDSEQHKYDNLDATGLEEKQTWLSKQMEYMMDKGQLDAEEKRAVAPQLTSKLEQLDEQLALAESDGKAKRAEKLRGMRDELQQRCDAVNAAKPFVRKVKFEQEIKAIEKRLAGLAKLENSKEVLPLAEVQKLNAKPKLLEDLAAMQSESRGWFWGTDLASIS